MFYVCFVFAIFSIANINKISVKLMPITNLECLLILVNLDCIKDIPIKTEND